jgi:hypothetical protein
VPASPLRTGFGCPRRAAAPSWCRSPLPRRCASTAPCRSRCSPLPDRFRIYVAGPLFSEAERRWLDGLARTLRSEGFDCFVPHENFDQIVDLTPEEVYRVDGDGLRSANALVAWLDGPSIDDGTAAEIGAFAELVRGGDPHYRGIVGVVTDLRIQRRRGGVAGDGMNLFVAGAIESAGRICWSAREAVKALRELA